MGPTAILLVSCPDRRGIVAAIADFLYQHNANILHADQHQDAALGLFLIRVEWDLDGFDLDATAFEAQFAPVAALREHGIELVVLARYMQILSANFVREFPDRIINIHHSFLPAFHGARPYHRACERGVKVIGATAHYVTEALDEGPIIEQDVTRVSHRDNIEDMIRKGADLEKVVLSRAVRWHLENRILTYANRTVVFG